MSEPTLIDAVAMAADLYRHEAVNAGQAVSILADVANIPLYSAALMIREFERQEHGEPADQWTDAVDTYYENRLRGLSADDWRPLKRNEDGTWDR